MPQNSEILHTMWFSPANGHIGLVITKNSAGQIRAFIASIPGYNEKQDMDFVADWGAEVLLEQAQLLVKMLTKEESQNGVS